MNKVYVLSQIDGFDELIAVGIYSSKELAEVAKQKIIDYHKNSPRLCHEQYDFHIGEFEIDEEPLYE